MYISFFVRSSAFNESLTRQTGLVMKAVTRRTAVKSYPINGILLVSTESISRDFTGSIGEHKSNTGSESFRARQL